MGASILPTISGAQDFSGTPTNGQVPTYNSTTKQWNPETPSSSSGTVSSVAETVPTWLGVSGSPITGAGTLAVTETSGVGAASLLEVQASFGGF
jgi:hypothetical protein